MMMTQEVALGNLTKLAKGLEAFVQQAAEEGFAAHEVEMEIWQRVLAMGRQAMGRFFDTQGEGDVGDSIAMPDGQQWQRSREPHRRLYQSIFGPFELERVVYGTREGQKIELVPLDARLELPQSEFYYVLLTGCRLFLLFRLDSGSPEKGVGDQAAKFLLLERFYISQRSIKHTPAFVLAGPGQWLGVVLDAARHEDVDVLGVSRVFI